jgi:hypothetical protein
MSNLAPDAGRSIGKQRALAILGVIILAVLIWQVSAHSDANQPAKATGTWKTITLSSEKLHFKVPPSWTTRDDDGDTPNPPQSISLLSPPTNNYYFSLEVSSGTAEDIYKNFLGTNAGMTLLKLPAAGASTPLYLVAQGTKPAVTGLALASSPGSDKTSFGIQDTSGKGSNNITMSVNLVTSPPSSEPKPYSLSLYQSQPEYKDVLGVFNSMYFTH